jgi:acetylornithine deacetylase/succinyl-diaminopimelate desuccinylase-like protein
LPALKDINLNARIASEDHTAYTGEVLHAEKFFPAWELKEDSDFVQKSLKGLRSAGLTPKLSSYRFCTNAAYSMGIANIPTIGFGPAAEGDAHVVDEKLNLNDLEKTARGYLGIIESVLAK